MSTPAVVTVLARSLLAGELTVEDVHKRAVRTLGRSWRWLQTLTTRYVARFAGRTRPRHRDVVQFLLHDAGYKHALARHRHELTIAEWISEAQRMQPAPAAETWALPVIESVGELARWLTVNTDDLEWFADLKGLGHKLGNQKLEHYRYQVVPKRSGGVRLTESPKPRLKELQRQILSGILDRIPIHPAVHGFTKGRSIVSFAAPHVGKQVVLRLDLQNFFPSFPAARVQALFRTLGYPDAVGDRLGGICTNAAPPGIWSRRPPEISRVEWDEARALYRRPHLPQGAPTSPVLANLTAYRLDCRLTGLAACAGAVYTRYADDLAFSGGTEFNRVVERFSTHAAAIALEEGFTVNHHKTRIMRQGVRQQLAGIVVNQTLNLRRGDVERLEAILVNCVRLNPESQNRAGVSDFRTHLEGRIGFVSMVNREKGQRLKGIFNAINWGKETA